MGFFNSDAGFDGGYTGVIDRVEFTQGKFGFQAIVYTRRDTPFTNDKGELVTESPVFVSVGGLNQGWEARDGGASFGNTDPQKKPRSNSAWMELLERLVELGAGGRFSGASDWNRGAPLKGLHVEWAREGADQPYKFTDKETGEVKEGKSRGRMMPVALLDHAPGSNGNAVGFDTAALGLSEDLLGTLKGLAAGSESAGAFTNSVLAMFGKTEELDLDVDKRNRLVAGLNGDGLWVALKG